MLKAGIYDPYLDTLGGGERYCLTVAETLINHGYEVDLFWSGKSGILSDAQNRFNLNLSKINIVKDIFEMKPQKCENLEDLTVLDRRFPHFPGNSNLSSSLRSLVSKYMVTKDYDLFFYLSDGSIPFLFSKKNFLHIQVPFNFKISNKQKISNTLKLKTFKSIITNSRFTQKFITKNFSADSLVLYPPVDTSKFSSKSAKENIILSVGRFDNILNAKKQDVLINAFSLISKKNRYAKWKLVLAGGSLVDESHNKFLHHLKQLSLDLPVEFVVNPSFEYLRDLYSRSKIYWHAAGFEVDENTNPEATEHFGMTIVEAMASGLVPVVVAKGGIPEIIDDGFNGYLWNTIDDLTLKTKKLIDDPALLSKLSQKAIARSSDFSKECFIKEFTKLL